jgi:hypothetical protein
VGSELTDIKKNLQPNISKIPNTFFWELVHMKMLMEEDSVDIVRQAVSNQVLSRIANK